MITKKGITTHAIPYMFASRPLGEKGSILTVPHCMRLSLKSLISDFRITARQQNSFILATSANVVQPSFVVTSQLLSIQLLHNHSSLLHRLPSLLHLTLSSQCPFIPFVVPLSTSHEIFIFISNFSCFVHVP